MPSLTYVYSDINSVYRSSASWPTVTDGDDVMQAAYFLLHSRPGDWLFDPTIGLGIDDMLFELAQLDETDMAGAFHAKLISLETQEPRISINFANSGLIVSPDTNSVELSIAISIPGLGLTDLQYREILTYAN